MGLQLEMGGRKKERKKITSGKRVHINHAPKKREEGGRSRRGRRVVGGGKREGGGQVEWEAFRGSVDSDTMLKAFMKKQGYDNRAPTPEPSERSFDTSPHCCFFSLWRVASQQVRCCFTKEEGSLQHMCQTPACGPNLAHSVFCLHFWICWLGIDLWNV